MRAIAKIARALIVASLCAWVCLPRTSGASEERYKIIVHPENPVATVGRTFLRDAFLKRAVDWGHGETIRPVDLSRPHAVRERFTQEVLKKSTAQLKSYWNQQIFSGKGVPPPAAKSPASVIEYVMSHPGAVGYLPAGVDPGDARVVPVD